MIVKTEKPIHMDESTDDGLALRNCVLNRVLIMCTVDALLLLLSAYPVSMVKCIGITIKVMFYSASVSSGRLYSTVIPPSNSTSRIDLPSIKR